MRIHQIELWIIWNKKGFIASIAMHDISKCLPWYKHEEYGDSEVWGSKILNLTLVINEGFICFVG